MIKSNVSVSNSRNSSIQFSIDFLAPLRLLSKGKRAIESITLFFFSSDNWKKVPFRSLPSTS